MKEDSCVSCNCFVVQTGSISHSEENGFKKCHCRNGHSCCALRMWHIVTAVTWNRNWRRHILYTAASIIPSVIYMTKSDHIWIFTTLGLHQNNEVMYIQFLYGKFDVTFLTPGVIYIYIYIYIYVTLGVSVETGILFTAICQNSKRDFQYGNAFGTLKARYSRCGHLEFFFFYLTKHVTWDSREIQAPGFRPIGCKRCQCPTNNAKIIIS